MKQDDNRLIDCYVLLFFAAPKESFLLVVSLDIRQSPKFCVNIE